MSAATLAAKVLTLIRKKDHVSYVELVRAFPLPDEEQVSVGPPSYPNIFYWGNIAKPLAMALDELHSAGKIRREECSWLVYEIDGLVPRAPVAKRAHHYKAPHWCPVVWRPAEKVVRP